MKHFSWPWSAQMSILAELSEQILIARYSVIASSDEAVHHSFSLSLFSFLGLTCLLMFAPTWFWISLAGNIALVTLTESNLSKVMHTAFVNLKAEIWGRKGNMRDTTTNFERNDWTDHEINDGTDHERNDGIYECSATDGMTKKRTEFDESEAPNETQESNDALVF